MLRRTVDTLNLSIEYNPQVTMSVFEDKETDYDVLCQEQKQHYPAAGDHLLIEEITDQEVMEEELTPQGTQDYQIKTQSSTCDKAKLPMSVRKLNTF